MEEVPILIVAARQFGRDYVLQMGATICQLLRGNTTSFRCAFSFGFWQSTLKSFLQHVNVRNVELQQEAMAQGVKGMFSIMPSESDIHILILTNQSQLISDKSNIPSFITFF